MDKIAGPEQSRKVQSQAKSPHMQFLEMIASNSRISHSVASENLRTFVKSQQVRLQFMPDPPRDLDVKPLVEADTGKLVTKIG